MKLKLGRVRHIGNNEPDITFHHFGDKADFAGEPIELRDNELCLTFPSGLDRLMKLLPVIPLP